MLRIFLAAGMALTLAGCQRGDASVGAVSGVVTLNGQPLAGATVTFFPESAGVAAPISQGATDQRGHYALTVTVTGRRGAAVGKHRVSIEVFPVADDSDDDDARVEVTADSLVPARYNRQTELFFEVQPGFNRADWNLQG